FSLSSFTLIVFGFTFAASCADAVSANSAMDPAMSNRPRVLIVPPLRSSARRSLRTSRRSSRSCDRGIRSPPARDFGTASGFSAPRGPRGSGGGSSPTRIASPGSTRRRAPRSTRTGNGELPFVREARDVREMTGEDFLAFLPLDLRILRSGLEDAEHERLHTALIGAEFLRKVGIEGRLAGDGGNANERENKEQDRRAFHERHYTVRRAPAVTATNSRASVPRRGGTHARCSRRASACARRLATR